MQQDERRDERLRRRGEQYQSRETPEQRRERLDRCNDYERRRYAALTVDQRRSLPQRRRERALQSNRSEHQPTDNHATNEDSPPMQASQTVHHSMTQNELPSFDKPSVISKITQFHDDLMSLTFNKCCICKENFPSLKLNAGLCTCCHADKHIPKLFSAENNMDPGPVPSQLKVSYSTRLSTLSYLNSGYHFNPRFLNTSSPVSN